MNDARPRLLVLAAWGLAMVTSDGSAAPPEMHHYVTIADVRYVVATLGERVRVTADPAPAERSTEARDGMRQAVIEATGCVMIEDRWSGQSLLGELDCRDRRSWKVR